ncbi:glycosyl hydrolase family 28-related protein [Kitasatospora sp. NPDC058170]|uniref:glycosyl hydrolase family 28-related protein n=1 Tax=Kitasatospora sp. NPDC058170 TaxID=3346364 RepID=UPI0036DA837D
MDIVTLRAAKPINAGQAVRTTGSPTTVTPAVEPKLLHTGPFFGVALDSANSGQNVKVQTGGIFGGLGNGLATAVGVNDSGQLVRATDAHCTSAPNWIGDCDASGTVTIRPRLNSRLSVLEFGAVGDGAALDREAIQRALDCAARSEIGGLESQSFGKIVYLPPGDYLIDKPLIVSNSCVLEGAGAGLTANNFGGTTRILADMEHGDFSLSSASGIGQVDGKEIFCAVALTGWETGAAMTEPDPVHVPTRHRGRADWGIIRQFGLQPRPGQGMSAQNPEMDGVRVMAHGPLLENVAVNGFRRNGITIYSHFVPPVVNTNCTQIYGCLLYFNGQHGLDIGSHGNDNTNSMLVMGVDASNNGRDGIHDHSFLGCTFVACHAQANNGRNYYCDRTDGPTCATYIGCYAEGREPSLFRGVNVVVVGGDIEISRDSWYWGYGPMVQGPPSMGVRNGYSSTPPYRGTGESGIGVQIELDELCEPGNGYWYRAIRAGRTYGSKRMPPENPPDWQSATVTGNTVSEHEGLVWRCEGSYVNKPATFNWLGGTPHPPGPAIIQDFGFEKPDGTSIPFFRTEVSPHTLAQGQRLQTGLTSGASLLPAYWHTMYEHGPAPGTLMFPDIWIGSIYYGERRIAVSHTGSPLVANTGSIGRCNFYAPGDLILNGTGFAKRNEGIGWAVKAACGRATNSWTSKKHYAIGQTVKPAHPNGNAHVYRLLSYTTDPPSYPLSKTSGQTEPLWNPNIGGTTTDKNLIWQTLYDLDAPKNSWAIEPLPQRAKNQADSTATTIAELNANFNSLLASMRAANLLEP